MTRLSLPQRLALEVVVLKKEQLEDERRAVERAIGEEIAYRTSRVLAGFENAVIAAHRERVPKIQIARAIGTSNPKSVRDIIRKAAILTSSAQGGRYTLGDSPDILIVRLDGEDLKRACDVTGWTVIDALTRGVDSATFKVTNALALVSVTPSFVADVGRLHPVVASIRRDACGASAWWKEVR